MHQQTAPYCLISLFSASAGAQNAGVEIANIFLPFIVGNNV